MPIATTFGGTFCPLSSPAFIAIFPPRKLFASFRLFGPAIADNVPRPCAVADYVTINCQAKIKIKAK